MADAARGDRLFPARGVPLGFILFVAYLSIFIPRTHFEAIVTIQVTALLSAVALYLSLPKLDSMRQRCRIRRSYSPI